MRWQLFFLGGDVNLALQPARFANASGLPAYPQLALKRLNTFVDLGLEADIAWGFPHRRGDKGRAVYTFDHLWMVQGTG